MGRAKLPEARIEPRGVDGHLAQLKAEARQHARVAGAVGVFLARVVGWTAFAAGTVAVLVWLAPPPKNPRLDEIRRMQADFQRYQINIAETQRSLELMQQIDQERLMQNLRIENMQVPAYNASALAMPSYDWKQTVGALPAWPPEPTSSYSQ